MTTWTTPVRAQVNVKPWRPCASSHLYSFRGFAQTWKCSGRGRAHDFAANKHTSPCRSHRERNAITGQMQRGPCRISESRVRKYPRNSCFWTLHALSTHPHTPASYLPSPLTAFTPFHHPACSLLLLSSTLIGLYTVVQSVTASSILQHCCAWLFHCSASYYTLSLLMQACLCDSTTVRFFVLSSFHLTCPSTQQQTAGNCTKLAAWPFLNS